MAILAGEIVSAGRLNRLQPVTYEAAATSTLNVTSSVLDVPGASVTLTTEAANAVYVVVGVYDILQVAATTNDALGRLVVDGVQSSKFAVFGGVASGDRYTIAQTWRGTLASAGSHTIKLAASAPSASQFQVVMTHTSLSVTIYEVV